ncbi:uncharacterized protein CTRU02_209820 [Colletotrichum truncatum]|uniref:Uncharacterized protein n=1 Tax=Colletotrichum truncatum TaxID=5467 RepID=A0ACC3YTN8_COLTU|nr:uncharacterized protein CTRU02_02391 [Colletotrichum truncatum]KAF6798417.1 hypothetical protein CTRU02_02391 [Colletotrichum truncatum]
MPISKKDRILIAKHAALLRNWVKTKEGEAWMEARELHHQQWLARQDGSAQDIDKVIQQNRPHGKEA